MEMFLFGQCQAFAETLAIRDGVSLAVIDYPNGERHVICHDELYVYDASGKRLRSDASGKIEWDLTIEHVREIMEYVPDSFELADAAEFIRSEYQGSRSNSRNS